jgi:hypothetical protein
VDGGAAVIPNVTRGGKTHGVLLYLVGEGKREEHEDPRLVAGSPEAVRIGEGGVLDRGDAAMLARFLDQPRKEFGTRVTIAERDTDGRVVGARDAHVWHCSLSLHPNEPELADERWSEFCERFIEEMGFAGETARAQCRWVALRHGRSAGGSDHAHVVVTLVAEDGSKANVHNDRPRAQKAARVLEQRLGLRQLEARKRGAGSRGVRAGERMADARRHRDHGPDGHAPERGSRQTLERIVRGCATASRNESQFVRALREQNVRVRPRYAEGERTVVVGYSVRLPGPGSGPRRDIWFGGGRLARDLTLPSLRASWQQSDAEQQMAVKQWSTWTTSPMRTQDQRHAELEHRAVSWQQCVDEIDRLRRQLRSVDNDPAGAARVARDGAGILAAWSLVLEGDHPAALARASRSLARSAELRAHRRRSPRRPRPHSSTLALYLLAGARPDSTAGWLLLARQVSLLGRDLARLHHLRGELDRARELETELAGRLHELRRDLGPRLRDRPGDPEAAAVIECVLKPLPAGRRAADDAHERAAAARRVIDAERDQRRPRGR